MKNRRRCPVCHRTVMPTTKGNIQGHTDTTNKHTCPMSGEPYAAAEIGEPTKVWTRKPA